MAAQAVKFESTERRFNVRVQELAAMVDQEKQRLYEARQQWEAEKMELGVICFAFILSVGI